MTSHGLLWTNYQGGHMWACLPSYSCLLSVEKTTYTACSCKNKLLESYCQDDKWYHDELTFGEITMTDILCACLIVCHEART